MLKWVYQIQNLETQKTCANELVSQIIRVLYMSAIFLEKILDMLKKHIVHLGLDKKKTKELQISLIGFIKAVSFIIYFRCFSFPISTKLGLLILGSK